MARLQILELPAGSGDDQSPFILVVDEYQPRRYILGVGQTEQLVDEFDGIAERIGARAVLTFVETVDIPASENAVQVEPLPHVDDFTDLSEAKQLIVARDEARMWARHGYEIGQRHCGWSDHGVAPDWLTEGWPYSFDSCEHLKQAAEYDEALTRVRAEVARIRTITPTWDPVADLIEAALNGTPDARQSTGRPTHPDGSPYNYSEITAGGWHHCDGCRTWGQWTTEKPHDCINSQAIGAAPDA